MSYKSCAISLMTKLSYSYSHTRTNQSTFFPQKKFSVQHPCPLRRRFRDFHSLRGNVIPGTAIVGFAMTFFQNHEFVLSVYSFLFVDGVSILSANFHTIRP